MSRKIEELLAAENWDAATRFGEVIAEQLYQEAIDEVMAERKPKYTVQEVPQSDGTKLLVVVVEKAI